ncbi:MAG: CehA/McbA family metallohydrolase [Phycisphaerales bacterium]|nr:MAG: CehA/McbA family metallohydrolase [Phycisphaerales bacterium]
MHTFSFHDPWQDRRSAVNLGLVAVIALQSAALAHEYHPEWVEPDALDQGVYVDVQHPRVIRERGPVEIKVTVRNVATSSDLTIDSVRYTDVRDGRTTLHRVQGKLPTTADTYQRYHAARSDMRVAYGLADVDGVERLARRLSALLGELSGSVFVDRYHIGADEIPARTGDALRIVIEVNLIQNGTHRTLQRLAEIAFQPPLPHGREPARVWSFDVATGLLQPSPTPGASARRPEAPMWYAGDQHLHTTYSIDAFIVYRTEENVADYATAAELSGLDWIIITDHSNVHFSWRGTEYYAPEQFAEGAMQAESYSAEHSFVVLYGQEMGAGQTGPLALPSHYLAYPFSSPSTGYLENPSTRLIFNTAGCEPQQVIIDRVNDAGGFGFIAHPFRFGILGYARWDFDNHATGWAGVEIWSDKNGEIKRADELALRKWHELLDTIPGPQEGVLAERPDFPNAFPVGLGSSDAHEPRLIGATFTYARADGASREDIVDALMNGRCVASNGPLLFGELNGAQIGDVAILPENDNDLHLTLMTTPEFGPAGDYALTVFVNGAVHTVVPPTGDPGFSLIVELDDCDLAPPDTFVTVRADSVNDRFHAITNPIWLQFAAAGDANADGTMDLSDLRAFSSCLSGPNSESGDFCDIMDADRDNDVDLADFAVFEKSLGAY